MVRSSDSKWKVEPDLLQFLTKVGMYFRVFLTNLKIGPGMIQAWRHYDIVVKRNGFGSKETPP